jgi:hypothetical protein
VFVAIPGPQRGKHRWVNTFAGMTNSKPRGRTADKNREDDAVLDKGQPQSFNAHNAPHEKFADVPAKIGCA